MYGNNDLSLAQLLYEKITYMPSHRDYLRVPWICVKSSGLSHGSLNLPDKNVFQLFCTILWNLTSNFDEVGFCCSFSLNTLPACIGLLNPRQ